MNPGATFERVYAALKEQLRSGRFAPGERLEPAALSEDLNSSVTPVRDALHRLVGERLVEAPRHNGFRAPLLTEMGLRHLYAWHSDLLLLILGSKRARSLPSDHAFWFFARPVRMPAAEASTIFFLHLAQASGNPEHAAALIALNDRLSPVRTAETRLIANSRLELEHLLTCFRAAERRQLRDGILAYHRRRERLVPELLAALQRPPADPPGFV